LKHPQSTSQLFTENFGSATLFDVQFS